MYVPVRSGVPEYSISYVRSEHNNMIIIQVEFTIASTGLMARFEEMKRTRRRRRRMYLVSYDTHRCLLDIVKMLSQSRDGEVSDTSRIEQSRVNGDWRCCCYLVS
jgi:hypothetical protein